jgi:hypothetical protein
VDYFACLLPYETIYIEAQENFQKQTYRNRSYILTSQKVDILTVPVIQGQKKQLYTELKIDYSQPWVAHHWRAICTAYGKAPYFEYLATYFQEVLHQGHIYLFELNWAILQLCLKILGIQKEIRMTDRYMANPDASIRDIRSQIQPQNRFNSPTYYQPFCYQQVFGTVFIRNLSVIDLLFCEGPNAYNMLNKYSIKHPRNCYIVTGSLVLPPLTPS